jgi:hypothetical protein
MNFALWWQSLSFDDEVLRFDRVVGIMNKIFVPLLAILFSACCCCPYSPFAGDLTVEKPNSADIVGKYRLTGQNLAGYGSDAEALQGKQPEIVINADGSCLVTDFPVWKNSNSTYVITEWRSFEGKWTIHTVGSVRKDGKTCSNWGIGCGNRTQGIGTGELTGTKAPYGILFIYGDPDSGDFMAFTKQP